MMWLVEWMTKKKNKQEAEEIYLLTKLVNEARHQTAELKQIRHILEERCSPRPASGKVTLGTFDYEP